MDPGFRRDDGLLGVILAENTQDIVKIRFSILCRFLAWYNMVFISFESKNGDTQIKRRGCGTTSFGLGRGGGR